MKRVWHPYWLWEDCAAGMWDPLNGASKKAAIQKAIEFTGDAELYGKWMMHAIESWPIACEHNLTEPGMNRLAWIGHAAACMAIQVPEDVTRIAWGELTEDQRIAANIKAQHALNTWLERYEAQNSCLGEKVGKQGVFEWDTGRGAHTPGERGKGAKLSLDLPSNHEERCGAGESRIHEATLSSLHGNQADRIDCARQD